MYKKCKGQMTILVMLVFLTLFLLFAFVVNIGVLISEKVNLQNSADLGAYAGAAMQARVLNKIGYLNFRMRQNWKEFAFHNWVTHMRGARDHPAFWGKPAAGTAIGPIDQPFKPGLAFSCVCLPGTSYQGITANFCQKGCEMSFPGVDEPALLFLSPVTLAFAQAAAQIREEIYEEWEKFLNDSEVYSQVLVERYKEQNDRFVNVLNSYIQFINEIGRVTNPIGSGDPISQTVQNTILKNLSVGNAQRLDVRSLVPSSSDSPWFKATPIITRGLVVFAQFLKGGGGERIIRPSPVPIEADLSLGVGKNPTTLTYYALRLISKPKLIYLPDHWQPILVAYSAAKPFGSRVGPQPSPGGTSDKLIRLANAAGDATSPNFAFYQGDKVGIKAHGQLDILSNYITGEAEEFNYPTANNQNSQAIASIRAPNHYEAMRYPIFVDPTKTPMDPRMFAQVRYPDGIEFQSGQNLFQPDEQMGRSLLFSANDGPGNDMKPDLTTLNFHNDTTGERTFRANVIQTRSSYASPVEFDDDLGRTGYSVKLISMIHLITTIFQDAQGVEVPIENFPSGDPNVENRSPSPAGSNIWH